MKRNFFAAVVLSLAASAPAFAGGGGIGRAGSYGGPTNVGPSQVTRAEVRAQIDTAYENGTLPALNKPTYPNLSLEGQRQAANFAADGKPDEGASRLARGE
ncbi:DUF4148 domain-containing protein [Paraburkholderia sp. BCC1885]|uniref:DUF4148 domain-containing protein n=1 Tax=Paraburkholderia sp. BCC1885 TaxID=2562669 RepID=UPI00118366D2|nr:DUF4148 domain-containing protein [Paraburkholderia sp. BCC1885]